MPTPSPFRVRFTLVAIFAVLASVSCSPTGIRNPAARRDFLPVLPVAHPAAGRRPDSPAESAGCPGGIGGMPGGISGFSGWHRWNVPGRDHAASRVASGECPAVLAGSRVATVASPAEISGISGGITTVYYCRKCGYTQNTPGSLPLRCSTGGIGATPAADSAAAPASNPHLPQCRRSHKAVCPHARAANSHAIRPDARRQRIRLADEPLRRRDHAYVPPSSPERPRRPARRLPTPRRVRRIVPRGRRKARRRRGQSSAS